MTESKHSSDARFAIFTVVSNNYLHFARTLLQSTARHHPEAHLYCVIVDTDTGPASEFSDEFSVLPLQALAIPDLKRMAFQYDVLEMNTAVKPWAFEALLAKGYDKVIYLDPDIFVYRPLSHVTDALENGSDIVITPHLLKPIADDKRPTELDIRRAGTYNFGFCAVRKSLNTSNFLRWWQGKLTRDCIIDMDRGIFVDQSWIDLVPGLFDNVCILRNAAYNIAYWNLAQRAVTQGPDGSWTVDNEPLAFFHFSGFNPMKPEAFSKHQNRFTLSNLGPAAALVHQYASALIGNGAKEFVRLAYGYARFSDGTAIHTGFRRLYLQNETLRRLMGDDPFSRSDVLTGYATGDDVTAVLPISWLMYGLYRQRPDLQASMNLLQPSGVANYWSWFIENSSSEVSKEIRELHRKQWVDQDKAVDQSSLRCHELFASLLNRSPTAEEVDRLGTLCRTKIGASVALIRVARMPESRNRPRPTRRFKKTLRQIWRTKSTKWHQLIRVPEQPDPSLVPVVSRGPLQGPMGVYPPEPESSNGGVWCGTNVSIPLGNTGHARITIIGSYDPSLLERMNSRRALCLDLRLDGKPWKRVELPDSGEVLISESLPEHLSGAKVLRINADGAFVPSAINISGDQRELSWRLRKIVVDDLVIFDSGREQPFLPMTEMFRPSGFNLIGYVFAELGVGEAARTMASAAHIAAIPYSLHDVGYQTENRQSDRRAAANAVDKTFPVDILYVNADQTQNALQYIARKGHPRADYTIGFWHWEQPKLPEIYWSGFEGLDEIWVPTAFVQEAVSSVSPIPVFKVPHAVDFTVDPKWSRASFGIPAGKFAVLVMYDFHSYRFRKNPEAAIAAFKRTARGRSDMALVIKTINASKYMEDYAALKAEVADLDCVIFIDEVFSRDQIYGLEACCDCMLSLHRAEGFGFGPAEMMFLGKPVIATGWSGNMEFMTHDNSFPVNYELKPLAKPLGAYAAGLDWAEPDVEHAAECLRKLVEDQALVRQIGRRAQETMRTKFSPEAIGRQYRERLALVSGLR